MPVVLLGAVGLGAQLRDRRRGGAPSALGAFNLVTIRVLRVRGARRVRAAVRGAARGRRGARAIAIASPRRSSARSSRTSCSPRCATLVFLALRARRSATRALERARSPRACCGPRPGLFCFAINKVLLGVVNGLRRMRAFAIYTSLRYVLIAIGLLARARARPRRRAAARDLDVHRGHAARSCCVGECSSHGRARARRAAGSRGRAATSTTARAACSRRSPPRSTRSSTSGCSASRCPNAQVGIYSLAVGALRGRRCSSAWWCRTTSTR